MADSPSRGDCSALKEMGFKDVTEAAVKCLNTICMSMMAKLGETAGHAVPRS